MCQILIAPNSLSLTKNVYRGQTGSYNFILVNLEIKTTLLESLDRRYFDCFIFYLTLKAFDLIQ